MMMMTFLKFTQSRIKWKENHNERFSTSGWPVDISVEDCLVSLI